MRHVINLLYLVYKPLSSPSSTSCFMLHNCNCSLELPPTITMSSFNRDLDYYGLVPEEGAITHACIGDVLASLQTGKSKYDMFCLAVETHHQYVFSDDRNTDKQVLINFRKMNETLFKDRKLSKEEGNMFLSYLDVYFGLRMTTSTDGIASHVPTDLAPYSPSFRVIKK